jgi:RNA polymerase sigma-70 factor (ECF subfamily)
LKPVFTHDSVEPRPAHKRSICDQNPSSFVLLYRTPRSEAIDTSDTTGAEHLFEELFRRYELPICTYLARLTGDPARAEELAQETFVRAYCALVKGERWDNPRAWLYRVASRLATDHHRRQKLLQWLPLWDAERRPGPDVEQLAAEQLCVQAALEALPLKYRTPLVLYVHEGYRLAEVAELLDISVSATKSRLCRARRMFRAAYDGSEEQREDA